MWVSTSSNLLINLSHIESIIPGQGKHRRTGGGEIIELYSINLYASRHGKDDVPHQMLFETEAERDSAYNDLVGAMDTKVEIKCTDNREYPRIL